MRERDRERDRERQRQRETERERERERERQRETETETERGPVRAQLERHALGQVVNPRLRQRVAARRRRAVRGSLMYMTYVYP